MIFQPISEQNHFWLKPIRLFLVCASLHFQIDDVQRPHDLSNELRHLWTKAAFSWPKKLFRPPRLLSSAKLEESLVPVVADTRKIDLIRPRAPKRLRFSLEQDAREFWGLAGDGVWKFHPPRLVISDFSTQRHAHYCTHICSKCLIKGYGHPFR